MGERLANIPQQESSAEVAQNARAKVDSLVLQNPAFSKIRADMQKVAIETSVSFIDAPDSIVHAKIREIRQSAKNRMTFAYFDNINSGKVFSELYDKWLDEPNQATFTDLRVEAASREARVRLAGQLKSEIEWEDQYKTTVENQDFKESDALVRVAVKKFA